MAAASGERLDGRQRRLLATLADLSQRLAISLDLEQTLGQALQLVATNMNAEAATAFLIDPADGAIVCRACVGPVDIKGLRLAPGTGIVGRAIENNRCEVVADTAADPDFAGGRIEDRTGFVTNSLVCAPLVTSEGPIGALQVLNRLDGSPFDSEDCDALRLLASPTALAIYGARLAGALVEQTRLKREMSMARRLQRSLLPKRRRGGFPIRAVNLPAREISGDFYDFFSLADGRIAFALGDVAGKGLDAAFLMVRCASLLRWAGKEGLPPSAWLERVNAELSEAIAPGMFVCALVGIFDPVSQRVEFANGGLPPVLRIDEHGGIEQFDAQGPPLGILPVVDFPMQSTDLADATLYLYSDGVTDAKPVDEEMLGVSGVAALLSKFHRERPGKRMRAIVESLRQAKVNDDITLMSIDADPQHRPDAAGTHLLALSVQANPTELRGLRHRLTSALEVAGVNEADRQRLVLCVDEAATNIIRHAYGGPCRGIIDLEVRQLGREIRFRLRDEAESIEADQLTPKALGECRPGGLGLSLIDSVMDSWRVEPDDSKIGNRFEMRWTMPEPSASQADPGNDDESM